MTTTPASHLAHAAEWFTIIPTAYGHDPLYLHGEDAGGRRGTLPAFIVRRPMGGTIVSSMPFLDGGGPCSSSVALEHALVTRLLEEASRLEIDREEAEAITTLQQQLDTP